MTVLVNFANDVFKQKQQYQNETALNSGAIDKIFSFSPDDIDEVFFKENKEILSQPRGSGYWLWKPYFILKVLETLDDEDYLLYLDSGAYFIDSINSLIPLLQVFNQDILVFHDQHLEKIFTKRDAFLLLNCDFQNIADTDQIMTGFHLWKKTSFTLSFAREWLIYCKDPRLLTDLPNTLGKNNYPNFIEHRHDQSIFSLLCKKYNLKSIPDPSQYGNQKRLLLNDSQLKQIFHHTKADKIKRNLLQKIIHELLRPFRPKKSY